MISSSDMAAALAATNYEELFERQIPVRRREILARPNALAEAHAVLRDARAPAAVRFLAAELLLASDPKFPPAAEVPTLVALYAETLDSAETGDRWGMPGDWIGQSGKHFVRLGKAALPALKHLFHNRKQVAYSGSERATLGQHHKVRIKDLAAFLASRILGVPYVFHEDPSARDAVALKVAG